jgi:outer membrane immunogenic protein
VKKLLSTFSLATLAWSCLSPVSVDAFCPPICQTCCEPIFRGLYIGGNAGFASISGDRTDLDAYFGTFIRSTDVSGTSWTGGIQLGYDFSPCSNLVLGLVADWNRTNAKGKTVNSVFNGLSDATDRVSVKTDWRWFATIRARAGYPICNFLMYITGGAAYADIKTRFDGPTNIFVIPFSVTNKRWGWVAGLGAEWALACRWSVNAEILHMRFDEVIKTVRTPSIQASKLVHDHDFDDDAWVGRIGINYRFCL